MSDSGKSKKRAAERTAEEERLNAEGVNVERNYAYFLDNLPLPETEFITSSSEDDSSISDSDILLIEDGPSPKCHPSEEKRQARMQEVADAEAAQRSFDPDQLGRVLLWPDYEDSLPSTESGTLAVTSVRMSCRFSVGCRLDLRYIVERTWNIELRERWARLRLRSPYTVATVRPTGKISCCVSAASDDQVEASARRVVQLLVDLGYQATFQHFYIFDVAGQHSTACTINLYKLKAKHRYVFYEPELSAGAEVCRKNPAVTTVIFHTGRMTFKAKAVQALPVAVLEAIHLVSEFKRATEGRQGHNRIYERTPTKGTRAGRTEN